MKIIRIITFVAIICLCILVGLKIRHSNKQALAREQARIKIALDVKQMNIEQARQDSIYFLTPEGKKVKEYMVKNGVDRDTAKYDITVSDEQLRRGDSSVNNDTANSGNGLTYGQREWINMVESEGCITYDAYLYRVYVDPGLWCQMDAKLKYGLAMSAAVIIHERQTTTELSSGIRCEVYDMQSGKRLARYGESYGFKVF